MSRHAPDLDLAFRALAAPFDMSLPSFMQHLDVLEQGGLVRSHKAGRVRTYELVQPQLRRAAHWLEAQRDLWERRFDLLDALVTAPQPRKSHR